LLNKQRENQPWDYGYEENQEESKEEDSLEEDEE
jgi:hypothetical protein